MLTQFHIMTICALPLPYILETGFLRLEFVLRLMSMLFGFVLIFKIIKGIKLA